MANDKFLRCTKCKARLREDIFNFPYVTRCPACGAQIRADVFPALFRDAPESSPGETLTENESSCFYHPEKKAVVPCSACGRFLCALCDIDFNGRHLCPACLETGKKKGRIKSLEDQRYLYDNIALFLAVFPMLVIWPTIVTAPAAIFVVFRYWKAPTSIVGRIRWRFVLAFFIAAAQIVLWLSYLIMD